MVVTGLERQFVEVAVNRDCSAGNGNVGLHVGFKTVDFFECGYTAAQFEFAAQNVFGVMVVIEELRDIIALGQISGVSKVVVNGAVINRVVFRGEGYAHFFVSYGACSRSVFASHIPYPELIEIGVAAGIVRCAVFVSACDVYSTADCHCGRFENRSCGNGVLSVVYVIEEEFVAVRKQIGACAVIVSNGNRA